MRIPSILSALALVATLATGIAGQSAPDFQVVVHPDNPITVMSRSELAQLFLKQKTRWADETRVEPIDQLESATVRQSFSDAVLRRSVQAVEAYWQQQVYSGREVPPVRLRSDAEVVAFVAGRRGAIGYVAATSGTKGVKVVPISG